MVAIRRFLILGAVCVLAVTALLIIAARFEQACALGLADRISERQKERNRMVETQLHGLGRTAITDERVLKAMREVPRHLFVPERMQKHAYDDTPLPIGYGQTISQPYIVALMTQALELKPGMKVLEIGTGSGYQAAILGYITRNTYSIEIIDPLYKKAKAVVGGLQYNWITLRRGDGYYGIKEFAPFDGIIVACAAQHIPPPLFDQLKPGGKMVIPVGGAFEVQRLLLVTKDDKGRRSSKNLSLVRFVPLVRGKR